MGFALYSNSSKRRHRPANRRVWEHDGEFKDYLRRTRT
jgi:hypothetical protein